jgi:hypothetical protein
MYTNLVRISTYAKLIGKTTTWVRQLIKNKSIEIIIIDNTIFIKTDKKNG